jgi:hypothetical protein
MPINRAKNSLFTLITITICVPMQRHLEIFIISIIYAKVLFVMILYPKKENKKINRIQLNHKEVIIAKLE